MASDDDWAIHILTAFPSVGPELAKRVVAHFGGVPLAWVATEKELMQVPGIGKTRAQAMVRALEGAARGATGS